MTDFRSLIVILTEAQIEFVLVGGLAARVHGSARFTEDIDVVYRRTPENLARIVTALAPLSPYLRGAPPGLPFLWDEKTLERGLNFTLTTSLGALDLLGEIPGGRDYDELVTESPRITLFGRSCLCIGLKKLIHVKRAAGRPKDIEAVAELEALLAEGNDRPAG